MATFTSPRHGETPGTATGLVVIRHASRRELGDALGLLFGMFAVLLILALTVGGALAVGQ